MQLIKDTTLDAYKELAEKIPFVEAFTVSNCGAPFHSCYSLAAHVGTDHTCSCIRMLNHECRRCIYTYCNPNTSTLTPTPTNIFTLAPSHTLHTNSRTQGLSQDTSHNTPSHSPLLPQALQVCLQGPLESLLLLDRLLYLKSTPLMTAQLVPLFSDLISPRNVALVGVRRDQ